MMDLPFGMVISVAQKMCFFHLHRDLGGLSQPLNRSLGSAAETDEGLRSHAGCGTILGRLRAAGVSPATAAMCLLFETVKQFYKHS